MPETEQDRIYHHEYKERDRAAYRGYMAARKAKPRDKAEKNRALAEYHEKERAAWKEYQSKSSHPIKYSE